MLDWDFYLENYRVTNSHIMRPGNKPVTVGPKPNTCRICGCNSDTTTFKNDAHIVPEFAGNSNFFSNEECDRCNVKYGLLEDDLGKLTLIGRTVGGVPRKKSGLPRYKNKSESFSMHEVENNLLINHIDDGKGFIKFPNDQCEIELTLDLQPFRPLAVFKSLVKIGYMLLPADRVPAFSHLNEWLKRDELCSGLEFGMYSHGCIASAISGWHPTIPFVALLERSTNICSPFCILLLVFGHFGFQVIIPCPNLDAELPYKKFSFRSIPVERLLMNSSIVPDITYSWADLSNPNRVNNTQYWVARGTLKT